jgi:hypothetical protein
MIHGILASYWEGISIFNFISHNSLCSLVDPEVISASRKVVDQIGAKSDSRNASTLHYIHYEVVSSQPVIREFNRYAKSVPVQDLIPAKIQMNDDANLPYSHLRAFSLRTFNLIPESLEPTILFFRAPTICTSQWTSNSVFLIVIQS